MKTAILLGAGSSLPAGYPSTLKLTDLVLSGDSVLRISDGTYQLTGQGKPEAIVTRLAIYAARRLFAEAERYFSALGGRPAHYEDLFYLAKQASDEELGEMENPAIRQFASQLRADLSLLVENARAGNENPDKEFQQFLPHDYRELMNEICNYISDIVWGSLCKMPERKDHLAPLLKACQNGKVTSISTLCHDTHVEKFLSDEGVLLADGFSGPEHNVRYWNGDYFSKDGIPFLKLHGSVDWFRLGPHDRESFYDDRLGIPLDGDHEHTRTDDGTFQLALDGRPELLMGTFNKITNYSVGIFRELHYHFRSILRNANQMVVCGYSFGDKGINSEIIEWYYAKRGRRFVIIHPDRYGLVGNARGAITNKWDEWKDRGSIAFIEKRLECVGVEEFMAAISLH